MLYDLKSNLSKKSLFIKAITNEAENLTGSCEVCLELVKHKKCFRDGELMKHCAIKMANAFRDSKIAEKFKTASLSHQTVGRIVTEMADNVSDTLLCVMNDCEYYSLGLDGSTDFTDVCQLMTFVRKIDKNCEIKEEFPKLLHLPTGTKGSDVFEAINKVVSEFPSFERCTGIVTDGDKSMVESKTGLVGHLKQLGIKFVFLHCIIHQEAPCGKLQK
jgi:hypothetical protein